jgi:hypothetical protein
VALLLPAVAVAMGGDARAQLEAACRAVRVPCVEACPRRPSGARGAPYSALAIHEGGFTADGSKEAVVSLVPCGSAIGIEGAKGIVVLVAAGPNGWASRSSVNGVILPSSSCKIARAARAMVLCQVDWGPFQGISGQSACVTRWAGTRLKTECPARLSAGGEEDGAAGEFSGLALRASGGGQTVLEVRVGERRLDFAVSDGAITLLPATAEELARVPIAGLTISEGPVPGR